MFNILHISDLHRSGSPPVSNSELISCLVSDSSRWPCEDIDAIIVSGDLVEGVPLGSSDPAATLRSQYEEALSFLDDLSNRFVGGDRSKIILVPGNHDVDWNAARSAMQVVSTPDINHFKNISTAETPLRWSWKEQKLYRISNLEQYEQRFFYFWEFYKIFYDSAELMYGLEIERPWNIFALAGCGRRGLRQSWCVVGRLLGEVRVGRRPVEW